MEGAWAVRIDGEEAELPPSVRAGLGALASEARARLAGQDLTRFVDVRRVRDHAVVTVAIGPAHAPVRAQRGGRTIEDAVRECCDSIQPRLRLCADHAANLSTRAPVCESLLETWLLPAGVLALDATGRERLRDERFLYHLSDEEALVRADLGGDPFYVYGARGRSLFHALLRIGGRWHRIENAERPFWQSLVEGRASVSVELVPSDRSGPPAELAFTRAHRIAAATLDAAIAELDRLDPPVAAGPIGDLPGATVLVRESASWIRAFGYEDDPTRIAASTGPFGVPTWVRPSSAREGRSSRIRGILACPRCRASLAAAWSGRACPGCGAPFTVDGDVVSFGERDAAHVVHDADASRNTQSKQLLHDLRLNPDGLVLNVGAGDGALVADNLVNLEICRYAATDVVADAHALPFADGSFDVVFSQSVLEHVRDPFACASEMIRVLKEGGVLLADVPFLAPFHGYPNHYFNASMNGLRQLFSSLEEIGVREGPHHAPALTLFEVLSRFCAMIREDDARKTVLDATVRELLDLLQTGRRPGLTRDLDPERTFTISAGFSFYGVKRGDPRA